MSEWQSIETAPTDQKIWVWNGKYSAISRGKQGGSEIYWQNLSSIPPDGMPYAVSPAPTHWMPLPEPPNA